MTHTIETVPKESLVKFFKEVEKTLSPIATQKLLYLELLHNIIQAYPQGAFSPSSPTSPYFMEGQKAPVKHASLIMRIIKNNKLPQVILRPQNPEQIVDFLQLLWQKACEKQPTNHLQEKALGFIQLGIQLETKKEVETTQLFDHAFSFGQEYFTFCLERI